MNLNLKKTAVENGGNFDSDRTAICPNCGEHFDGEVHTWEAGEEECPYCEYIFQVEAIE